MSKYFPILLITFFSKANAAVAQDTVRHANPIISAERNSASFYDRLDHVLKTGEAPHPNAE